MERLVRNPSLWAHAYRVKFFWLLMGLIGVILVTPAIPSSVGNEWESLVMVILIFFAASYVSQGWKGIGFMIFLSVLLIIGIGLNIFTNDSNVAATFVLLTLLVALTYTSICVLSFVLVGGRVGAEHIYGAICAYVLIAMAFATLDFILETWVPGSFSGVHAVGIVNRPWWQFFYFSFTTQSTVGYGDIVPVTMRARSFVMIQQLIAIFYVAILISRLTGMYNLETSPEDKPESQT